MGRYCGRRALQSVLSGEGSIKMKETRPHQGWKLFPHEISHTSRECVRKAGGKNKSVGTVRGLHALGPKSFEAFLRSVH